MKNAGSIDRAKRVALRRDNRKIHKSAESIVKNVIGTLKKAQAQDPRVDVYSKGPFKILSIPFQEVMEMNPVRRHKLFDDVVAEFLKKKIVLVEWKEGVQGGKKNDQVEYFAVLQRQPTKNTKQPDSFED